jgi:alpha-beta hydrolase superfamily lysophospholipase
MHRLIVLAFFLVLPACVAGNPLAGALVRPMRVPVVGAPDGPHHTFQVTAADGVPLDAWLLTPVGEVRGLVAFVHGKDINRQHFLGPAKRFLEKGVAVVAHDQRAHGRSGGEFVTYGAKEVGDLRLVLDAALAKLAKPALPVALVGESLGAAVVLQAAPEDARVRVVCAGAPFSDLATVIKEKAPGFVSADATAASVKAAETAAGFKVEDISPERAAARTTVPVLLLHGSEDNYLPLQHSMRFYAALAGPKELVRLEGVKHIDILLHDESWDAIERFLAPVFAAP